MVGHTPGPWHLMTHNDGSDHYVWGPDGQQQGCIARVNLFAPYDAMKEEREANARLIAAAPELLQALRPLVNAHDHGISRGTVFKAAIEAARAAIAKAEGRQP